MYRRDKGVELGVILHDFGILGRISRIESFRVVLRNDGRFLGEPEEYKTQRNRWGGRSVRCIVLWQEGAADTSKR